MNRNKITITYESDGKLKVESDTSNIYEVLGILEGSVLRIKTIISQACRDDYEQTNADPVTVTTKQ